MNQKSIPVPFPIVESLKSVLGSYYQLTKPSIMLLVLVTGATAMVMEGSLLHKPGEFALVLFALYLTGGCANALNQYLERDVDKQMARTRNRRPLPQGRIGSAHALGFSIAIGAIGVAIFGLFFNWLTASLAAATILFYSLVYTLLLKPNTAQNIVIGGAAGAMAPVGAWAAATGHMAWAPWTIFMLVFFWTPPHFWSLALFCKDDYKLVGYPMLPVLKGERTTLNQILIYTFIMVAASLTPIFLAGSGWFYGVVASLLGLRFIYFSFQVRRSGDMKLIRKLFGFSIVYLFSLCFALCIDCFVR